MADGNDFMRGLMAKYDPLRDYLRKQTAAEIELSFPEIERLVGRLPASAGKHPEWWSNEDASRTRHVQSKAWQEAGFLATFIEGRQRVRFRRK